MISVREWAEIRRLRAEGVSISEIARLTGTVRNTVKAALASEGPPRYERPAKGSAVDEFEPRVRELLAEYPRMPATVIAQRIGWARGMTVLKERIAELRPVYLPPDPASRTTYQAGRDRAVRSVVPGHHAAGRCWAGPHGAAPAGTDDGVRLFAMA